LEPEKVLEVLGEVRASIEGRGLDERGSKIVASIDRLNVLMSEPSVRHIREITEIWSSLNKEAEWIRGMAPSIDSGLKLLYQWAERLFMAASHALEPQRIEMAPVSTDGFILDIGGGGEGIIGKLNGRDVVAIDTSERELEETENESLKVVMDASDLKFLPSSFDVATSFFTLLFIDGEIHAKVFGEVLRVLKDGGRFLIWDVEVPDGVEGKESFFVPLVIELPGETVTTGYGVRLRGQSLEGFKELAEEAGFEVSHQWIRGKVFHLELRKA